MAQNTQNVFVPAPPIGGAVWSAPAGTTVPTDASTPLSDAFKSLGFISEDGITNSEEKDTSDIKAYGGAVVRTATSSYKETYTMTPIETNAQVLAVTYGDDNVSLNAKDEVCVDHNAKTRPARVYVVESLLDGGTKVSREVIPAGRVTAVGDREFKDGQPLGRQLTITCEQDETGCTSHTYYANIDAEGIAPEGGE